MIRLKLWRALALAVFAAALPAHAGEVYQISTISSLLAGGYDGDTTVAELLRHGSFGLGTFNGVDGEMMVLDGRVYRGTIDGRAHAVAESALTPFAVVVELSFFGVFDDELLLVLCVVRRRRAGAFAFVVFGRVLRKAPRTSSSPGSCALTTNIPTATATRTKPMAKHLNLICVLRVTLKT